MPLCAACDNDHNGDKYYPAGPGACDKCLSEDWNLSLFIIGVIAGLVGLVVYVQIFLSGATEEAAVYSVVLKIFLNTLQLNQLCMSLEFQWGSPLGML